MKVLVLAGDPKERALIQSALDKGRHEVSSAASVTEALDSLATNRPRFLIVDEDIGTGHWGEIMSRVRAAGQPSIYVLSLTSAAQSPLESDDILRKPFTASELSSRIGLAQRFLALGDSLTEARSQIETLAMYDALTGLLNRIAFYRVAQGELERARRAAAPLSVIALELDNFRDLIAAYGGAAAEESLRAVATTIRERSRPYDVIGRWAGAEFIEALPGVFGEDAEKIAGRIIKGVLSTEVVHENQVLTVGMSAGIASIQQIHASTEIQPLIDQARSARARARESGGNQALLTFV